MKIVESKLANPGHALERLVQLSRESLDGRMTATDHAVGQARFEEAVARLAARRARRPRRMFGWATAAAVGVTVLAGWWGLGRRDAAALSFQVRNGAVSHGGYVSASMVQSTEMQFSDGSNIVLEPGSRSRVSDLDARGGRVLIETGRARVHVQHRPRARWSVEAGPYTVRVLGTTFDLGWSGSDEILDLNLRKGSVLVKGPLAEKGLIMQAGQRLVARVKEGKIFLGAEPDQTAAAGAQPGAVAPAVADPARSEPELAPRAESAPVRRWAARNANRVAARNAATTAVSREAGGVRELSWSQRLSQGDFHGIVEDAERAGLESTLSSAPAQDLSVLADAARYARRTEIARRALLAERRRFPNSRQARDAAFFLGGVSEDDPSTGREAALAWYERYLRENPDTGTYLPQALGRKMVLLRNLQGLSAAQAVATEYLARFPEGPYAAQARRLLQH